MWTDHLGSGQQPVGLPGWIKNPLFGSHQHGTGPAALDMTADDFHSHRITEGRKPQTKRIRFSHLTAFFNFMRNNFDCDFKNPCDSQMLRKLFRPKAIVHWDIIEKDTVDEIIFRTNNVRNRLMLELMARGGMRVGEVLKLTPKDILDRKLILNDTKSGKEQEIVFIPQKVADRLKEYVRFQKMVPKQMIFPICYGAARAMVKKAGQVVGIRLRPHDLRRHAATFASRSNVPLEIISKVILRHSNLSTIKSYNCIPARF